MAGVTKEYVKDNETDWRLDKWFKVHFPGLSYGRLSKILRKGEVRVDGIQHLDGTDRFYPEADAGVALEVPRQAGREPTRREVSQHRDGHGARCRTTNIGDFVVDLAECCL